MSGIEFKFKGQDELAHQIRELEHNIPIFMASLRGWVEDKKPNMTRGFIHHLDAAFKQAEDLGMLGYEKIRDLYLTYTSQLKPSAEKVTQGGYS